MRKWRRFVLAGAVRWLSKLARRIYLVAPSRDIVKYAQLTLGCFYIKVSLDWEYDKHIPDRWLHDRSLPVRDICKKRRKERTSAKIAARDPTRECQNLVSNVRPWFLC